MQSRELFAEGELQQFDLFQFLHLLSSHLLKVCLQLLDLFLVRVHVPSVVTVAVLQFPELELAGFEGLLCHAEFFLELDDVQFFIFADCLAVLLLEGLVVHLALFNFAPQGSYLGVVPADVLVFSLF